MLRLLFLFIYLVHTPPEGATTPWEDISGRSLGSCRESLSYRIYWPTLSGDRSCQVNFPGGFQRLFSRPGQILLQCSFSTMNSYIHIARCCMNFCPIVWMLFFCNKEPFSNVQTKVVSTKNSCRQPNAFLRARANSNGIYYIGDIQYNGYGIDVSFQFFCSPGASIFFSQAKYW